LILLLLLAAVVVEVRMPEVVVLVDLEVSQTFQ
jgi:hypothetical protein